MTRVLVSLLGKPGKGNYNEVEFIINFSGKSHSIRTEFSFDALRQVFNPDETILIGTRQSIWERAAQIAGADFTRIEISASEQEADQWAAFQEMTKVFDRDAEFILDITHGYRHLPILTFLSAQFIRALNPQCRMKYVYYGLMSEDKTRTFMVDLSKFMQIMDWMNATRLFTTHGKGYELANLLGSTQDQDLSEVSKNLRNITDTLELVAAPGVPVIAQDILDSVNKAQPNQYTEIYALLKNEIKQLPEKLSTSDPDWKKYLLLAQWYEGHNQWAKAVLTLREAFVTFVGESCGFKYDNFEDRKAISEKVLNKRSDLKKAGFTSLVNLWLDVSSFRNDIGHAQPQRNQANTIDRVKALIYKTSSLLPAFENNESGLRKMRGIGEANGLVRVKHSTPEDLVQKFNPDR